MPRRRGRRPDGKALGRGHQVTPSTVRTLSASPRCLPCRCTEFSSLPLQRYRGCQDYSLYDFRISPEGDVYFLEACLYCSFAPRSVIVSMANATEDPSISHPKLLHTFLDRAASRRVDPGQNDGQMFGMKAKTKKAAEVQPAVVVG